MHSNNALKKLRAKEHNRLYELGLLPESGRVITQPGIKTVDSNNWYREVKHAFKRQKQVKKFEQESKSPKQQKITAGTAIHLWLVSKVLATELP